MTATDRERQRADSVGALCALLGESGGGGDPQVAETAARAGALIAADGDRQQVDEALHAVDEALRRAGDPRGLLGRSRGAADLRPSGSVVPGVRAQIKVALCPGEPRCPRREPARDLWPAPMCTVTGVRMRKERLRREP
ncbi:hypothetical protein ACFWIA_26115 [Streptomyces sp. NPDC127068]|uniref:hypothetical protein n=1 Tax=Streptomyces sp. NPDC127068 TaxID=3347127 RepID=UPI003648173B